MYWYNPIYLNIQSATTGGVVVSDNLVGQQFPLVEGLAIDYVIPEPSSAVLALAAILAVLTAARRRCS